MIVDDRSWLGKNNMRCLSPVGVRQIMFFYKGNLVGC